MTATRDQLIADWRERLSSAEADAATDSPRLAWLMRVRVRLYRFLLSLYGDGDWRADAPGVVEDASPTLALRGSGEASPTLALHGKPAKGAGKISAVLKAVANAQSAPCQRGPLAGGLAKDSWVVVASTNSNLDPFLCTRLLRCRGIATRLVPRGDAIHVEVQAADEPQAASLLDEARASLHRRDRGRGQRRCGGMLYLVAGVLVGPLIAAATVLIAGVAWPALGPGRLLLGFYAVWALAIQLGALAYVLDPGLLLIEWFRTKPAPQVSPAARRTATGRTIEWFRTKPAPQVRIRIRRRR